jgi:hypothetical protein
MQRDVMTGMGFWLLVAAFVALMVGRVRAEGPGPLPFAPAMSPAQTPGVASPSHDEVWSQFHGQVVFSDVLVAPTSAFPSDRVMVAALHRIERNTVEGTDGFWRLHAIAFLDPAPPSGALRLRATDVTIPKQRHEVRVFELATEAGTKELPLNDIVLTDAMGFAAGHKYEVAIERGGEDVAGGIAGKQDVYAKGVITLR